MLKQYGGKAVLEGSSKSLNVTVENLQHPSRLDGFA
jgi:hypothetical protein